MVKNITWSHEDSLKFYRSESWKSLRKRFIDSLPYGSKRVCSCCGKKSASLHVDHIIPISIDPTKRLDINNLQLLCKACNLGKSNKDTTRMTTLTTEQKRIKASTYKKEFYSTKWFAPTSTKKGVKANRVGFFKKEW